MEFMMSAVVARRARFLLGVLGLGAAAVFAFAVPAQAQESLKTDDDLPVADDYDCVGGEGDGPKYTGTVRIEHQDDQYRLDADDDGIGCEGPNEEIFDASGAVIGTLVQQTTPETPETTVPRGTSDTATAAPPPSEASGAGEQARGDAYSKQSNPTASGEDGASGGLPFTGPGLASVVFVIGMVLLLGGAVFFVVNRRREALESQAPAPDAYPRLWKDPVERWAEGYDNDAEREF